MVVNTAITVVALGVAVAACLALALDRAARRRAWRQIAEQRHRLHAARHGQDPDRSMMDDTATDPADRRTREVDRVG